MSLRDFFLLVFHPGRHPESSPEEKEAKEAYLGAKRDLEGAIEGRRQTMTYLRRRLITADDIVITAAEVLGVGMRK